jgi:hypothetical protein
MSYTLRIPGGYLSMVEVDFKCPKCECPHGESDYYKQLRNSPKSLIYKSCKGCKTKLGITLDMKGDVVVWLKENERTLNT